MIDELTWVRDQRPEVEAPSSEARRQASHALDEAIARAPRYRRRRLPGLSPGNAAAAAALLVVVAVVAVFLGTRSQRAAAPLAPGGPELVFRAEPAGGSRGVSGAAVTQAASLLRRLLGAQVGRGHASVTSSGDRLVVHLSRGSASQRLNVLLLARVAGRLSFYDWEANVLTSRGKPVASRLASQDPEAVSISQGRATSAPGSSGAGALPLYRAVRLAADQPGSAPGQTGRSGGEYFAFAAPGSSACAAAAGYYGDRLMPTEPCYLAGPAATSSQVLDLLPPGATATQAKVLAVPAGTVVVRAVSAAGFEPGLGVADPGPKFFVLQDHPGISGTAIRNPGAGTDPSGARDITFAFTSRGAAGFRRLTAQVAQRGDLTSGLGQTLNQHFAIALGDQLVSVPSIDFKTYPAGISGDKGADITGFTARSIEPALLKVRLGSLPITLRLLATG